MGNNEKVFKDQKKILKKTDNYGVSVPFEQLSPMSNVLNSIDIGIAIFHAEHLGGIVPTFCNETFLNMSGLTNKEFSSQVTKENFYDVHPDDYKNLRLGLAEAYSNHTSLEAMIRVRAKHEKKYKWISMHGSIDYKDDDSFDLYCLFTDAAEQVREKEIFTERYKNLIERNRMSAVEALSSIHLNVTADTCAVIHRTIETEHEPAFGKGINVFILSVYANVADAEIKERFVASFKREALIDAFNKGVLSIDMKLPIATSDGRVVWCHQYASLTRNPRTDDIECIMSLVDDDKDIRLEGTFNRITSSDYEMVININVKTQLVTAISETNDRGVPVGINGLDKYSEMLETFVEALVEEEFKEDAMKALAFDKILSELEKRDVYMCTYPAKSSPTEREAVLQWRVGYIDELKNDIVMTRVSMMPFLDKRQKVQFKRSEAQIKSNAVAEAAKKGVAQRNRILIADDVEINRELLRIIFEDDFDIIEAADGEETINLIDDNYDRLALVLLDLQMPKKTGLDVLMYLKMRGLNEHIPVMMVTGSSSKDLNLRSLEYGISDIVTKPFDSKIVKRRALNLIELYAHKEETERQLEKWKEDAIKMHAVADKNNELLINALSSVVEFRSLESGQHIKRVRVLTEVMLENWGAVNPEKQFSKMEIDQISRASAMHDIGKVAIPDSILMKPGRLTPEEFAVMKTHTTLGCQMLENIKTEEEDEFYNYCYDICRYHHERSDGRGYPDGLKGDEIPIWSQIVSIVDVFDALTSQRVYKAAYEPQKAVEMIRNGECGCFSDKLLACFDAVKDSMIEVQKSLSDEEQDN